VELAGHVPYPDLAAPLRAQPQRALTTRDASLERVSRLIDRKVREKYEDYCNRLHAHDPEAIAMAEDVFLGFFTTCLEYQLSDRPLT
jgi:hypothetical protein